MITNDFQKGPDGKGRMAYVTIYDSPWGQIVIGATSIESLRCAWGGISHGIRFAEGFVAYAHFVKADMPPQPEPSQRHALDDEVIAQAIGEAIMRATVNVEPAQNE